MSRWLVEVEGVKSDGRGSAGGATWVDAEDVGEAIEMGLRSFSAMWDRLGHGAIVTYRIEVACPSSPRRARTGDPMPVKS